jgi:hypothetical protein
MLNNSLVTESAKHFAAKLLADVPTDKRIQIHRAYGSLYGRIPNAKEVSIGEQFLDAAATRVTSTALSEYIHVLLCANEFCYVD